MLVDDKEKQEEQSEQESEETCMHGRGEIIIYQTEDGSTKINVNMQNKTVWLSLDQMAELF